jgi:hypothetical protein
MAVHHAFPGDRVHEPNRLVELELLKQIAWVGDKATPCCGNKPFPVALFRLICSLNHACSFGAA